jgi:hypothetical protein
MVRCLFSEEISSRSWGLFLGAFTTAADHHRELAGRWRIERLQPAFDPRERLGELIEPARLQALPAAEFCLSCADRAGV